MTYNQNHIRLALLKLERSKEQLEEILLLNKTSWKENKIEIVSKVCNDKKGYEFHTNDFSNNNLLEEISVRIGEFIHNLRSTLDNLIFGFARMQSDPPKKPKKLSFPIYTDEKQFIDRTKDIFNQIPEILKKEIIKYQPFSITKKSGLETTLYPLRVVNELSNNDKHRVPVIMFADIKEVKFKGSIEFDNEDFTKIIDEENGFYQFFEITPNSKIFEFRTLEKIEKMNLDFDLSIDIAIDYPNNKLSFTFLKSLYEFIDHVINDLVSVLKENSD